MTLGDIALIWVVCMCAGVLLGAKEGRAGLGLALTTLLGPLGLLLLFAVTGGLQVGGEHEE